MRLPTFNNFLDPDNENLINLLQITDGIAYVKMFHFKNQAIQ